jgi:molybdopterin biosynthesis enzyme
LDVAGQHLLRSAVLADGFVLVPLQSEGYAEGASVTVYRY